MTLRGGRRACGFGLVLLALAGSPALAFGIDSSDASYVDHQYRYEMDVTLDAPIDHVEAVLRDYEHYPELDPRILQARVLERPSPNLVLLETMLRACFGPFCRNVRRVERVEEMPHALTAITDAARSDVEFGETYMQLSTAANGGTRVLYRTSITPRFWVPPLYGRHWMLNTLEDATNDLFMNVEMKAKKKADGG
jgi:Polyketide cyclase / dehydrase and lipid transport.